MAVSAYEELRRRSQPRSERIGNKFLRKSAGVAQSLYKNILAPHANSLKNLASIPLTATGTGFIDFAAFHLAHGWGWLVTGISLMALEHVIADRDEQ